MKLCYSAGMLAANSTHQDAVTSALGPQALDLQAAHLLDTAKQRIQAQSDAVASLIGQLGEHFIACIEALAHCSGNIVVTGMGKSGHVGRKLSATLASTGAPSFFVHAAEAIHGDLGRIQAKDVVLALSNSGESAEIVRLIRPIRTAGAKLVAITSSADSTLGQQADINLEIGQISETCPMGLVPTASTTVMMVLGDTLAMALFDRRGLGEETYARYHPGGSLGRKLLKVEDVMRTQDANPIARDNMRLREVIGVMSATKGRPGAASIVDAQGMLVGFFTDGDLRRLLQQEHLNIDVPIVTLMHQNPKCAMPHILVTEAAQMLRAHRIDQMPVVNHTHEPVGLLDIQDIILL